MTKEQNTDLSGATGALIRQLASDDPAARNRAVSLLFARARASQGPEGDLADGFRNVLRAEWEALDAFQRLALLEPLVRNFLSREIDLLTMEFTAMALVWQGEDGATEIVSCLDADDFVIRHKAAIAIGLLDRSHTPVMHEIG